MLTLKCLATGSSGNCYLLSSETETLILDCGLPIKEIKKGLDWDISRVVGVCVTHAHADHSKSVKDFESMGIQVFKPYEKMHAMYFLAYSKFTANTFDLTDKDGHFKHTNADGTECPCYGFLIQHPDMGRLLYITDTELVKWRFKDINHIVISCNYQSKYINDDKAKRNHVLRGHMELETVKEFVKANKSNALRNVILCHLSRDNSNPDEMVAEVQKVAGMGANVDYARAGLEVELKDNMCPF